MCMYMAQHSFQPNNENIRRYRYAGLLLSPKDVGVISKDDQGMG